VTAIARDPEHLDLFLTGTDGGIYSAYWDESRGWSAWFRIGDGVAQVGSPVTAIARNPQHLDLCLTGTDGGIYSAYWDDSSGWSGWFRIGDGVAQLGSLVTAIARSPGYLDLFLTGTDGGIYSAYWDESRGWSAWFRIGDGVAQVGSPVTAIARSPQHLDLFLTGTDGGIYSAYWDGSSGWSGWFRIGDGVAQLGSPVTAIARSPEHLDLFLTGTDGGIYSAYWGPGSDQTSIKHVFVLMLENRSFDHLLGFSQLNGTDTLTGKLTTVDGLEGDEANVYEYVTSTVSATASDRIDPGPPHNFNDALIQLCGPEFDNVNLDGRSYPQVKGSGYAAAHGIVTNKESSGQVMRCFSPDNLRVLTALAQEFVVCDHWYSSMPGPTEPNRMFVHAANSGNWDDSPSSFDQVLADVFGTDISFEHGTIFDRLRNAKIPFRIYAGDDFPNVGLLHGVSIYTDVDDFEDFEGDINDDDFDAAYTFIEPNYDVLHGHEDMFRYGDSQHPPGSVAAGERLIKQVYEIIRKSPRWDHSLLLITWDEHGGFYDHVLPPRAAPTGLRGQSHGFMFDQLGPRVPAVVVSPLVPKNMVEHRTLEHSVIPATVEQLFGLSPLTVRDGGLVGLQTLATLPTPRTDTPTTLPEAGVASAVTAPPAGSAPPVRYDSSSLLADVHDGWLVGVLRNATKQHLEAAPNDGEQIKARVSALRTVGDLQQYVAEIQPIVRAKRAEARIQRVQSWRVRLRRGDVYGARPPGPGRPGEGSRPTR
jgi:phospholipase C